MNPKLFALPPCWRYYAYSNLHEEVLRGLARHLRIVTPANFFENSRNFLALPTLFYFYWLGRTPVGLVRTGPPADGASAGAEPRGLSALRLLKNILKPLYVALKFLHYFLLYALGRCNGVFLQYADYYEVNLLARLAQKLGRPVYLYLITYVDVAPAPSRNPLKRLFQRHHARLMRNVLRDSRLAFAASKPMEEWFGRYIPKERVVRVSSSVSLAKSRTDLSKKEARRQLGWPQKQQIFLAVGRYSPFKGFEHYLAAAKHIPKHRFVLMGSELGAPRGYRQALMAMAPSNVDFADNVPPEKVAVYMRAADALAQTSTQDNYNATLIEAMMNVLPIASFSVGIKGTDAAPYARLVKTGDTKALARTLASLARKPYKIDVKKVRERWSIESLTEFMAQKMHAASG